MSRRVLLAISPSGLFCASANSRWSNDRLLMRYHTARLAEWDLVGSLHQHRYSLYIKPHVQTIVYRHGYHNNHLRRLTVTELQELKTTKRELLMQLYDASSEPNIVTQIGSTIWRARTNEGLASSSYCFYCINRSELSQASLPLQVPASSSKVPQQCIWTASLLYRA